MNFIGSRFTLLALGFALFALPLRAQLLNGAYEAQLVTWINQGPLNFTSIFTKVAGDGQDAFDFHAATDDRGPIVALFDVTPFDPADSLYDSPEQLIGGFTLLNWDSSNIWPLSPNPADQNAFIFNLTSGAIQRENSIPSAQIFSGAGSSDLSAEFNLEHGSAVHRFYGDPSLTSPSILANGLNDRFQIDRLEVYSVAPASSTSEIPEPAAYGAVAAAALLTATVLLRRKNRAAVAALQA
jgi:hypothetical protein